MKKTLLILFMMITLWGAGAASVSAFEELDTTSIDAYVEKEMRVSRIPGLALGIIKDGEIVYLQGYGEAGGGKEVSPQTPFVIGSLSKSITAVAAMQLVEEGKLELDAPVQHYLPWFAMNGKNGGRMTVRQLLVQTSGIPNMAGLATMAEEDALTLEDEVRALNDVSLEKPPGEAFIYSNANYQILGLLVAELTQHEGYAEHVQAEVFAPLQMKNSYLSREAGAEAGMAVGHTRWFGLAFPADVQYLENALPSGFIISSAEDMCRYLLMHLGKGAFEGRTIVSEAGASLLHQPGRTSAGASTDYAMGLVVQKEEESTIIQHDGSTQGFNSAMAFSPAEDWGVVVLTNTSGMLELPAHPMALGITDIIRGREPVDTSRRPLWTYLLLMLFVLAALVLVVRSLIILPRRWGTKLRANPPRGFFSFAGRIVLPVALELLAPVVIFILIPAGAGFPVWELLALFHPDLVYGILILAALLLVKALWRSFLAVKHLGPSQTQTKNGGDMNA